MQIKLENFVEQENDYVNFQLSSITEVKINNESLSKQWEAFCQHLNQANQLDKEEKFMLLKVAWSCLQNRIEQGALAQLSVVAEYLKTTFGLRLFHAVFAMDLSVSECQIVNYIKAAHLLIELKERNDLYKLIKSNSPNLSLLVAELECLHTKFLLEKYPQRNIAEICDQFTQKSEAVTFPLATNEVLDFFNTHNPRIQTALQLIKNSSLETFKEQAKILGNQWRETANITVKYELVAILTEAIRRHYKIMPYDTQLMAFWALINTPKELKGRIAQLKTGEGKSTLIAMLGAFFACQGYFVDIVTSSCYLAERDCKKYRDFFNSLGLSAAEITNHNPKAEHFHGQILYGINTDFEFAMLRDGLNQKKLRSSECFGKLIPRTFDISIIDEVDNLFLNQAMNSAIMSIEGNENYSWIYEPIYSLTKKVLKKAVISSEITNQLRAELLLQTAERFHSDVQQLSIERLAQWFESAQIAKFDKQVNKDYVIKAIRGKHLESSQETSEVVIVDYANTGRQNEGSQWQHGIHQFLQVKHGLPVTPESLTAASISHPTYFNLYKNIIGVTGTLGEICERDEIQKIYHVDSFDVPPRFPTLRKRLSDYIAIDTRDHQTKILNNILSMQHLGRPVLVLFKTIQESDGFSRFLKSKGIKNQLLNETQAEDEEYLVARAGEKEMITIATNTAGRGTDIILAPECFEHGLHVIFTFYPRDLRVELQGFGRAARQGQPGSCCMILNNGTNDFKSLVRLGDTRGLTCNELIKALDIHNKLIDELVFSKAGLYTIYKDQLATTTLTKDTLDAFLQNLRELRERSIAIGLSADKIIPLLNQARTRQITKESAIRYFCAQREALYFTKLQLYFNKLNEFYIFFEEYIKKPPQFNQIGDSEEIQQLESPQWQQVQNIGKMLLQKEAFSIEVDWKVFYEQFKHAYLKESHLQWGLFYSGLHSLHADSIEALQVKIEELYNSTPNINKYLNPQKYVPIFIHTLLEPSIQKLAQPDINTETLELPAKSKISSLLGLFKESNELSQVNLVQSKPIRTILLCEA